jgi:hypothetical protein
MPAWKAGKPAIGVSSLGGALDHCSYKDAELLLQRLITPCSRDLRENRREAAIRSPEAACSSATWENPRWLATFIRADMAVDAFVFR